MLLHLFSLLGPFKLQTENPKSSTSKTIWKPSNSKFYLKFSANFNSANFIAVKSENLDPTKDQTVTTNCPSGTNGRRGSLQLWQFLVALLDTPDVSSGCIAWTGRGMEFKLIEPEEVFVLFS